MRIISRILFLLVLCCNLSYGQPGLLYDWAKVLNSQTTGTGESYIMASKTDANGNIYVCGSYYGSCDFDPGGGVTVLSSTGMKDVFFAKYTAAGSLVFVKSIGGTGDDISCAMALDNDSNIYMAGYFKNMVDFDPGSTVFQLTSGGAEDIFIAKYDASGNFVFAKGIGGTGMEEPTGIALDAANNIHITGRFYNTADFDPGTGVANLTAISFTSDIFLAKYNSAGNYIFAKQIGGGAYDVSNGIALDGAGNIFIAGLFNASADFDPSLAGAMLTSSGGNDGFVAKYTANGSYQFAFKIGDSSDDFVNALCIDAGGNVCVSGSFSGTVDFDPGTGVQNLSGLVTQGNIFIAKYNNTGSYVFAKGIVGTSFQSVYAESIATDASNNIYVSGFFTGTLDFDAGPGVANVSQGTGTTDMYLVKYTAAGNYAFAHNIGKTGIAAHADGRTIAIDKNDNIIVSGWYMNEIGYDPADLTKKITSVDGFYNSPILKYTSTGANIWGKSIGEGYSNYRVDKPAAIARDGNLDVYVFGRFTGTLDVDPGAATQYITSGGSAPTADLFLNKYTPAGNLISAKRFGSSWHDVARDMKVNDFTGDVYVTGTFSGTGDFDPGPGVVNLTTAGGEDIFLAKFNSLGNLVYVKSIGSIGNDVSTKLFADMSGNVYVTGYFSSTVDFDPSSSVANLTSAGSTDIFLAKYDANGNYLYARRMGGTGADESNSIWLSINSDVFLTGSFSSTADFDPGPGTTNLVSAGSTDAFVARYTGASGNLGFAVGMGGAGADVGMDLAENSGDAIDVVGDFQQTADFDPGSGVSYLVSQGSKDIFLAEYGTTIGDFKHANSIGGLGEQHVQSLSKWGNMYITGSTTQTADFDPSTGVRNLTAQGVDAFVASYNNIGGLRYAHLISSPGDDEGTSAFWDRQNGVYITGSLAGTADFDFATTTADVTGLDQADVYFAHYSEVRLEVYDVNPDPVCAGSDITVDYGILGTANPGALYTLELSDAAGSFANPVVLAIFPETTNPVTATIPANTTPGTQYKVRITSPTLSAMYDDVFTVEPVGGKPEVTITSDALNNTLCQGTQVTFTAVETNGGTTPFYKWYKNGVSVIGISNSTYIDNALMNGDVISCVLTSSNPCVTQTNDTSNLITVTVKPPVATSVTIASNTPGELICYQMPITFTATPVNEGTAPAYEWVKNGVVTGSSATTLTEIDPRPGDIVYCKLLSSEECAVPAAAQSNSLYLNPKATVTITTTASPDTFWCEDKEIIFCSHFVSAGTQQRYQWVRNGVDVVGDTFSTYKGIFKDGDFITCRFYSNEPCVFPTMSAPVGLHLNPLLPVSAAIVGIPVSDGIMFHSQVINGGTNPLYQWLKNNADIVGETGSSFHGKGLQWNDKISVRVSSNAICPASAYAVSNVLTVQQVTGIGDAGTTGNISLYPNPNNGQFSLQGVLIAKIGAASLSVFNAVGQTIYSQPIQIGSGRLDVSINLGSVAPGIYTLKLQLGDGNQYFKFIVNE